ncbi:type III polyketide synthase [Aestuariivirga litoralis]|uniref:Type III polyketide synthase n=1 Tax=Aestuariivirga litoralis TaxID=2650924 RepID=A0A2W2ATH9_9HYPH|nr:type III polyketide synthase [Aestuariivirga litoralis]PZF78595.1 type III polyketide synthase [Aestuariivirga litoralis]
MLKARIVSLATAVPPHVISQSDAASFATAAFGGRFDGFEQVAGVFMTSGIRRRRAVRPLEWYMQPLGWPERSEAYVDGACRMFADAAGRALDNARLRACDIDTVVTVSSTGVTTPSLEVRVAGQMGFRPDVERVPVFGLGCAGGVSGLSIAARLAQSRPGSNVLLVAVEACTLSFRADQLTKANVVATALFGDGAAALVLRAEDGDGAEIESTAQHTWPDTLDIMGWSVDAEGLGVIFDRSIPPFAEEHFGPAARAMLARAGLNLPDIERFVCHPGGAKVVTALERALQLPQGLLADERAVLEDYGNMSAPTVFFVLERALATGLPRRTLMTAMGPGFTAATATLRAA